MSSELYPLPSILNAETCYYKGEGNAHLVIALRHEPKVLRILKYERNNEQSHHKNEINYANNEQNNETDNNERADNELNDVNNEHNNKNEKGNNNEHDSNYEPDNVNNEQDLRVRTSLVYLEKVILPLFSAEYFRLPQLALITAQHVADLNQLLVGVRPAHRLHKGIRSGYALVFDDWTLLPNHVGTSPVFSLELKPKQGHLATSDRKLKKCSFCLNQYLKLTESSIDALSGYCPLDLFSGVDLRMRKAIGALLAAPQNNFRIFRNGALVFGEGAANLEDILVQLGFVDNAKNLDQAKKDFTCLILNMLTRSKALTFPCVTKTKIHDGTRAKPRIPAESVAMLNTLLSQSCDFSSVSLPENCILDRILKVQQLDTLGADYVYEHYKGMQGDNQSSSLMDHFPMDLDPVESYLLSTMAKDCSVLISFQRIDESSLEDSKTESKNSETLSENSKSLSKYSEIPSRDSKTFSKDSKTLSENLKILSKDSKILSRDSTTLSKDSVCEVEGYKFVFKVSVVDVDAKPIQCIEKHYKRDIRIVKAAMDTLNKK